MSRNQTFTRIESSGILTKKETDRDLCITADKPLTYIRLKGYALIRELPHYEIGGYYGFNQEWYRDFTMNKGGCAATTAAEMCLLFKKYFGIATLYPGSLTPLKP